MLTVPTDEVERQAVAALRGLAAPHLFASYATGRRYRLWRHLCYLGTEVAVTARTAGGRLCVNVGPRWGKSELISHWTPAWYLAADPSRCIMLGTASGLARMYGGRVRDTLIEHPEFGVSLKEDTTAKNEWATPDGGGMKAVTVRESVMGRGANLLIIDDPYGSWDDAWSGAYRRQVEEWFTATINSRLEPGASVIVLHHRMHAKDLTNYIMSGPDGHRWKHISLPSIATGPDVLGRAPGESLCPERFSEAELEQKRIAARWSWEPMHQQNPVGMTVGRLYRSFAAENEAHVELVRGHDVDLCVDFNVNPGMHMLVGQHFKLNDTFIYAHEIHGPRMSLQQACAEFVKLWRTLPWKPTVRLFGDASGNAANVSDGRSNWTLLKVALRAAGINARDLVPFSNPGVIDSVNSLNEALCDSVTGERRIKVNPRCERLLTDFREVQADEDGKPDKSDEALTHASDTTRYHVHFVSPVKAQREERPKGRIG